MKNLKTTLASLLVVMVLTTVNVFAESGDKATEKAQTMVNESAPDDWQTLAKAADLCIRKGTNLTQAKDWFEKSLAIKESSLGLEVAGDYYAKNKLYDKAINYYVKSMLKAKEKNISEDTSAVQSKIADVKSKMS
jgi:tetratricopeptide (TPR) repeat protein